jgi:hypothetical protein
LLRGSSFQFALYQIVIDGTTYNLANLVFFVLNFQNVGKLEIKGIYHWMGLKVPPTQKLLLTLLQKKKATHENTRKWLILGAPLTAQSCNHLMTFQML